MQVFGEKDMQEMKELHFYFLHNIMPKMEKKNQKLALSACYLEIHQMNQLKVVALGP